MKNQSRSEVLFMTAFAGLLCGVTLATQGNLSVFFPKLVDGLWVTVQITIAAVVLSWIFAGLAGLAKLSRHRAVRYAAMVYAEFFRGTSLLVQLFWLFYVLPQFGVLLDPMTVGILGIALSYGAYGSEIVRGAVLAVPRGQWESATALNLSRYDTLRRIVLPQAIVAMLPPFGNLMIQLLKGTSLVSLITISDLTFEGYQLDQVTGRTMEIFGIVLVAYLCLSVLIGISFRALERRLGDGLGLGRA